MSQYYDRHLRGQTRRDLVRSLHTFSFGGFKSAFRDRFQSLNVINENYIYAGGVFKQETSRPMAVLLYVLDGKLSYEDTLGHKTTITSNSLQYIASDKGFHYTKTQHSNKKPAHYLEIWLDPKIEHDAPIFEHINLDQPIGQTGFTKLSNLSGLHLSPSKKDDLPIGLNRSKAGEKVTINIGKERAGFLHVVKGMIKLGGKKYHSGDSIAFKGDGRSFWYRALHSSEILLYEASIS